MNRSIVKTTPLTCGNELLAIDPAKVSPDLRAVFIVRIVVNAITCPLIILLNIAVMVAVKTKRQLRTKSNVALACLATTDLVVGLVVQPLQIALFFFSFQGEIEVFCSLHKVTADITPRCTWASLYHLLLMSAERYLAIKHPFVHENHVTKVRIIIASCLAWVAAIIFPTQDIWLKNRQFLAILVPCVIYIFLLFPLMIYFNIAVYKEVRRNKKQIAANQVSLDAKEKILKNKRGFCTTTIVLFLIFLCYVPAAVCLVTIVPLKDRIPINVVQIVVYLVFILPVLNSLFNPLIYAVRIRYFRVAFIQLFSRKSIAQAEELERQIFGPRKIGVLANVEQGQNGAGQEKNEQHVNETSNNGHVNTVRTQLQEESEEISL